MIDAAGPESDAALVDATLAALREERRRAPADLLAILTLLLVFAAVATFVLGIALGDGVARDVLVNLTTEILGAALTVVLIGGLWRRMEASSERALEGLVTQMTARRAGPLSEAERVGYSAIVDLHRRTSTMGFLGRLATGVMYAVRNRRRLEVLEKMLRP